MDPDPDIGRFYVQHWRWEERGKVTRLWWADRRSRRRTMKKKWNFIVIFGSLEWIIGCRPIMFHLPSLPPSKPPFVAAALLFMVKTGGQQEENKNWREVNLGASENVSLLVLGGNKRSFIRSEDKNDGTQENGSDIGVSYDMKWINQWVSIVVQCGRTCDGGWGRSIRAFERSICGDHY